MNTTGQLPAHAVVIGAGIAGLATATLLARDGYDVEIIERRTTTGGRCGSWERDGFRFDTGPSWYLMPEVFDHFFELCGTTTAQELTLTRLDPAYRVFFEADDAPVDVQSGEAETTALFESIEAGAGKKLKKYLESARVAYELAVQRFLYTSFASLRPLMRLDVVRRSGTLGMLLLESLQRRVARDFKNPRLQQILGYPAVFLGTSPDRAPSMYHLMSHMDLADGVLYPQGGFITLINAIERLALQSGVRILTGVEATSITTAPGPRQNAVPTTSKAAAHITGVTVNDGGQTRHITADVVIGAGDLHHLETQLLPEEHQTYPAKWWTKRDPGPGAVLLYLGVRGRIPELTHHNLLFTKDWKSNFEAIYGKKKFAPDPASIYVCAPGNTDPGVAPEDHENLFVLVPVPADPSMGRGGEDGTGSEAVERIADAAIAQISTWTGVSDLADRIILRRTVGPGDFASDLLAWSGGALGPAHTLKQSAMFRGRNSSKHVDGLVYAGASTIPGVGLPMCMISAEVALKRLRGDTSTEPLAHALPVPMTTTAVPEVSPAEVAAEYIQADTNEPTQASQ